MTVTLLKSKIHRAMVTDSSVDYEGSLSIDEQFMTLSGIMPYERILVGNITNGERFETYAIAAPGGSRTICLNGATAHLGRKGDLLVIMAFCSVSPEEAAKWTPRRVLLAEGNSKIVEP